jgi:hypothetical protein
MRMPVTNLNDQGEVVGRLRTELGGYDGFGVVPRPKIGTRMKVNECLVSCAEGADNLQFQNVPPGTYLVKASSVYAERFGILTLAPIPDDDTRVVTCCGIYGGGYALMDWRAAEKTEEATVATP